jgi:hypothetical protein
LQDDISQLLILNKKANVEQQIFASELEKFRPHQRRISATIGHQQQAIQDLTAAFKDLMDGDEAQNLQSQHDKADRLVRNLTSDFNEAKTVYFEIKEGLNRGIQFYSGVQDTVDNLKRNIQRFISDRSNERNRLMDDIESSKSSREQELLRETLNKYASAPPPPLPHQPSSGSSSISHLTNQTRQLSMNEAPPVVAAASAPYSNAYTPAPPPKPQAFQPQPPQQSPFGIYGANTSSSSGSTPTGGVYQPQQQPPYIPPQQQYGQPVPPPIPQPPSPYAPHHYTPSPAQAAPRPQPVYNNPISYQQPPPPQQHQPQYHQQHPQQPYYNNMAPPPPPPQQQPQQQGYQPQYQQGPPPHMQQQQGGMIPPQGYQPQPQYQQGPPPSLQQQWQQQVPPQQQWQQQPQQHYQQRPPPPPGGSSGNLLD